MLKVLSCLCGLRPAIPYGYDLTRPVASLLPRQDGMPDRVRQDTGELHFFLHPLPMRLIALIRVRKGRFRRIPQKIFRKKVAETLAGLKERRTFAPAIEKTTMVVER